MSTELTPTTPTTLAECEAVIERGLSTFIEVGNALIVIRDGKLYEAEYGTWEQYVKERWGWSRSYGYRMIDSASVAAEVSPIGDIPSEAVARELAPLKDDPDEMREVWANAIAEHGDRPTAKQVRQVVQRRVKAKERQNGDLDPDERRAAVKRLLAEGKSHREIATELGVVPSTVSKDRKALAEQEATGTAPRSKWHAKTRHIDSNRILRVLAEELDGAASGLELMERDALDPKLVAEYVPQIKAAIATINQHIRRVTR